MKYSGEKIKGLFAVLVILLLEGGASAATSINSCTTISSPGTYVLNQSISNSGATSCINITASNVTFDGQSNTIDGLDTGSTYGVYVYNSSTALTNITVKNLTVTDWFAGIYHQNTQNGNIVNNTASSNGYGIYLLSSSNKNTLTNNIANSNSGVGIVLSSSNNNTLTNNTANSNTNTGIFLGSPSNSNTLTNNTARWNTYGIILSSSSNNNLTNNTASSNSQYGIYLQSSRNNILTSNVVNLNQQSNIRMDYSSDNELNYNSVSNGDYWGIWSTWSNDNIFDGNIASFNGWDGIDITLSNNNTLIGNTINSNNHNGISLVRSGHLLENNIISLNKNYGLYIQKYCDGACPPIDDSIIYNNYFSNVNNLLFYDPIYSNHWNVSKTLGTNIIGGPYTGGNFWANPNGTGFSQTCADADGDGICDTNYILNAQNIDYLPLSLNFTIITSPVSTIGYSATVATGQNTYVQSSNGSFGTLLKGQTKTITGSVVLNNTGDVSAKVEARFNDSIGGIFGLISDANVLNATNFALGLPSALVPLDNGGADVQVAIAPPGVTALDARLGVPNEQAAGDYQGTVVLTFSNNV